MVLVTSRHIELSVAAKGASTEIRDRVEVLIYKMFSYLIQSEPVKQERIRPEAD
jgi:hypothetical protein